jgi:hypothetical protein
MVAVLDLKFNNFFGRHGSSKWSINDDGRNKVQSFPKVLQAFPKEQGVKVSFNQKYSKNS